MNIWVILAAFVVYGVSLWFVWRTETKDMCFVLDNIAKLVTALQNTSEELKLCKERVAECKADIEAIRDMAEDIAKAEAEFQDGVANIRDYNPYTVRRNAN